MAASGTHIRGRRRGYGRKPFAELSRSQQNRRLKEAKREAKKSAKVVARSSAQSNTSPSASPAEETVQPSDSRTSTPTLDIHRCIVKPPCGMKISEAAYQQEVDRVVEGWPKRFKGDELGLSIKREIITQALRDCESAYDRMLAEEPGDYTYSAIRMSWIESFLQAQLQYVEKHWHSKGYTRENLARGVVYDDVGDSRQWFATRQLLREEKVWVRLRRMPELERLQPVTAPSADK